MSEEKQTDWERIELDYRAGLLSIREIAESQGISHTAINKRAKKDGWERDLKAKIQAKADALVSKREVSAQVSKEQAETEKVIVEANAEVIANIRLSHRRDISRSRSLVIDLLAELEHETGKLDLFEELGDLLRNEDDKGRDKLNDLYRKVISSASRVSSMKALAETMKTLIGLEREAYGINDGGAAPSESPSGLGHFYGG